MSIENRDWLNWQDIMAVEKKPSARGKRVVRCPRPGHADLVGALKYDRQDFRDILERASARETAARVAVGAVAKVFLECFDIALGSWVTQIGAARAPQLTGAVKQLAARAEKSDVHCPDEKSAEHMRRAITKAQNAGDTLGGIFSIAAWGLVPGLGSHVHWDRRLDMRLAGAIMSIPAIKGVAFGLGFQAATLAGSQVHDSITYHKGASNGGFGRKTNHAGGVEGGISTGEVILVQAAMKPIATLKKPILSIDMSSKQRSAAGYERSDICAVPAAAVVGEAMLAITLVTAWQEKFGGDSISEIRSHWKTYQKYLAKR